MYSNESLQVLFEICVDQSDCSINLFKKNMIQLNLSGLKMDLFIINDLIVNTLIQYFPHPKYYCISVPTT